MLEVAQIWTSFFWIMFVETFDLLFEFMPLYQSNSNITILLFSNSKIGQKLAMKRGVSSGGGQSSLSYLFGADEAPKPAAPKPAATPTVVAEKPAPTPTVIAEKPAPNPNPAAAATADKYKQIPAGIQGHTTNNYFRADGQNTGNFITVWSLSQANPSAYVY